MCRLISDDGAAFVTAVDDDVALLGVGLCLDGAENTAAGVGSVAGVDIYMQRAQAEGTMVSRGVAEGQNLLATAFADEAVVVFGKSFVFHFVPLGYDFSSPG